MGQADKFQIIFCFSEQIIDRDAISIHSISKNKVFVFSGAAVEKWWQYIQTDTKMTQMSSNKQCNPTIITTVFAVSVCLYNLKAGVQNNFLQSCLGETQNAAFQTLLQWLYQCCKLIHLCGSGLSFSIMMEEDILFLSPCCFSSTIMTSLQITQEF